MKSCVTNSSNPHAHKLFQLASPKPAVPLALPKAIDPENSSQNSSVELHSPVFSLNQRQAWIPQSLNTQPSRISSDLIAMRWAHMLFACILAHRGVCRDSLFTFGL
jgi:hypothetical protein